MHARSLLMTPFFTAPGRLTFVSVGEGNYEGRE